MIAKKAVCEFFSRFGIPLQLHTDQGRNFDSLLMKQVCELLQIHKTRTTSYRPASNGQIERYNRTILQMIRSYLEQGHSTWDEELPLLTSAIRAIHNKQVGYSANMMMLGRETNLPIEVMLGTAEANATSQKPANYVEKLGSTLNRVHTFARENLKAFQLRQKKDYDTKLVENKFQVGDLVLEIDSSTKVGQSSKLKNIWKGPYLVTKVINPVLYEIEGLKKSKVVHHDRIKLCLDREVPLWVQRRRNRIQNGELVDIRQDENNSLEDVNFEGLSQLFELSENHTEHSDKQTSTGRAVRPPAHLNDYVTY